MSAFSARQIQLIFHAVVKLLILRSRGKHMAGRRSERSRKSVDYTKLSYSGNESNDDDDFMEDTPPLKRQKKMKNEKKEKKEEATKEQKPQERKARNRLTEEEKYERELEMALKISLGPPKNESNSDHSENANSSQPESGPPAQCTVEAEVLSSPNSKRNSIENIPVDSKRQPVINGATISSEDKIVSEPKEDTSRRKSGRVKKIKEKEDDEYEMSEEESESDPDISSEEESDMSDYEETPKKKSKAKKSAPKKAPKKPETKKVQQKISTGQTTARKTPGPKTPVTSRKPVAKATMKENKPPLRKPALFKPVLQHSSTTPKSCTSPLVRRSPCVAKFSQPGWTPPGPAGSKPNSLKSPQSPNVIRVGLSRNIKLIPLHPKVNVK